MKKSRVIIIGGGVAGIQTAITLSELGLESLILEKEETIGGKLNLWDRLFPSMTPASEVINPLMERLALTGAQVQTSTQVTQIDNDGRGVVTSDGTHIEASAVVVASGFDVFQAERKEEYGYGMYDNVYTTVDIERMFKNGRVLLKDGTAPKTVAFLHCVGSRDQKVNQSHCSRVCCITGVKQAIELKQQIPDAEIYSFYMDMRMFGPGYEELYRQAQYEYNIHFVRGKISEAAPTFDNRIQIKAEDTLIGRPLKMNVDMLILAVGMQAGASNATFSQNDSINLYPSQFLQPKNQFTGNVSSSSPRIYYAGTVSAPKTIGESINEAIAAANQVAQELLA